MPATLGGQFTIIGAMLSVVGAIGWATRRVLQYLELVTKVVLWQAKLTNQEIPGWLADQYKKVNGHRNASPEEIATVLGEEHVDSEDNQGTR